MIKRAHSMMIHRWLGLTVLLCGCTTLPDFGAQAHHRGMQQVDMLIGGFNVRSYQRIEDAHSSLHIYIEGDGRAFINRETSSGNPTPHQPVALQLALADTSPNVAYLARPCQFTLKTSPACRTAHWTHARFSEEIVATLNTAIDRLKAGRTGRIALIGYSGGAAIAALIAARRGDIESLRTVAGNLDSEGVNRFHGVSPMPESLNPLDVAPQLALLPQQHLIGGEDQIIPAAIAERFVAAQHGHCAHIVEIRTATHQTGWETVWPQWLEVLPHCDYQGASHVITTPVSCVFARNAPSTPMPGTQASR